MERHVNGFSASYKCSVPRKTTISSLGQRRVKGLRPSRRRRAGMSIGHRDNRGFSVEATDDDSRGFYSIIPAGQ